MDNSTEEKNKLKKYGYPFFSAIIFFLIGASALYLAETYFRPKLEASEAKRFEELSQQVEEGGQSFSYLRQFRSVRVTIYNIGIALFSAIIGIGFILFSLALVKVTRSSSIIIDSGFTLLIERAQKISKDTDQNVEDVINIAKALVGLFAAISIAIIITVEVDSNKLAAPISKLVGPINKITKKLDTLNTTLDSSLLNTKESIDKIPPKIDRVTRNLDEMKSSIVDLSGEVNVGSSKIGQRIEKSVNGLNNTINRENQKQLKRMDGLTSKLENVNGEIDDLNETNKTQNVLNDREYEYVKKKEKRNIFVKIKDFFAGRQDSDPKVPGISLSTINKTGNDNPVIAKMTDVSSTASNNQLSTHRYAYIVYEDSFSVIPLSVQMEDSTDIVIDESSRKIKQHMEKPNLKTPYKKRYQTAYDLLQNNKLEEAILFFQALIDENSKHRLTENCYYWLGMAYYQSGKYNEAIDNFKKVLTFVGRNKADDALLMAGKTYLKIKQPEKSREYFENLIFNYPDSEYKSDAKRYLTKLN